ncbi:hypothetical protein VTN49DRAFT_7389 [Thermomyces lanuginosus]|uniref:uncharacterized protein n=1 Tax=Thermomyces lanuginosus TaxID=5541 RepID=UPI003742CC55
MGTITKDDKSPNSLDRYKELPGALAEQSGAATGHLKAGRKRQAAEERVPNLGTCAENRRGYETGNCRLE